MNKELIIVKYDGQTQLQQAEMCVWLFKLRRQVYHLALL